MTEKTENNWDESSMMTALIDFTKIYPSMPGSGVALIGVGEASGDRRALRAVQSALGGPLWKGVSLADAKAVKIQIVGNCDEVTLQEVGEAMSHIYSVCPNAHVFYSHAFDNALSDRVQISVFATGFSH